MIVPFPQQPESDAVLDRYDVLQAQESMDSEDVARVLALCVFRRDLEDLDRRARAICRYNATLALRSSQDCWLREANRRAKDAVIECMTQQMGARFVGLAPAQYESYAVLLLNAMRSAYVNFLDGATVIYPGEYARIAGGRR